MESTDKLRKLADECYTFNDCSDKLMDIADGIEREIAERYMLLPVDADGVPIKPRDSVDTGMGDKGPVGHLEYWYPNSWVAVIEYKPGQFTRYDPLAIRHVKPRTVEDVLEEFLIEFDDWDWNTGGNDRDNARKQLFAKYADELRSMGVGE